MSSLVQSLVAWEEFLRLPERPETGQRYELQDGEVVIVPPARPLHIKLQKRIERLLEAVAGDLGVVTTEFPYRPVPNLQYWFADSRLYPSGRLGRAAPGRVPGLCSAADRRGSFNFEHRLQSEPPADRRPFGGHRRILGGGCGDTNRPSNGSGRFASVCLRRNCPVADVWGRVGRCGSDFQTGY